MASSSATLQVKRPTPATTLYLVSTRSSQPTWTTSLYTALLLAIRLLAATLISIAILHEYRLIFPATPLVPQVLHHVLGWLDATLLPSAATHKLVVLAASLPFWVRLALMACGVVLVFRRGYVEESLLVVRGLGVQTMSSSPSYLWGAASRFIPTSAIQDVFIHEAFKGFEVRYYLSIVVEGEADVVVVFPNILPRREILEHVWRGAKACLYELKS